MTKICFLKQKFVTYSWFLEVKVEHSMLVSLYKMIIEHEVEVVWKLQIFDIKPGFYVKRSFAKCEGVNQKSAF